MEFAVPQTLRTDVKGVVSGEYWEQSSLFYFVMNEITTHKPASAWYVANKTHNENKSKKPHTSYSHCDTQENITHRETKISSSAVSQAVEKYQRYQYSSTQD